MRHDTCLTGRSTLVTGFILTYFCMTVNKASVLRTNVPELRVLPCQAFIIGKNVLFLYCE